MTFPLGETKETANSIGVPAYWAFNNSRPEEEQRAAKDFISWLYIAEKGKQIIAEKFRFVPPTKGLSVDTVKDTLGQYILNRASAGGSINWVFMAYPPGFVEKLASDIQQYLRGALSWEEVLSRGKEALADARK